MSAASGVGEWDVQDCLAVGVCSFDERMHVVQVNRWLAEALRRPADECAGRAASEVFRAAWPQLAPAVHAVLTGAGGQDVDVHADEGGPEGGARSYRVSLRPARGETGSVRGAVATWVDVTQHLRVESALRTSEERLRHSVELGPHLIWVADPQGQLIHGSARWAQLTGHSIAGGLGARWLRSLHREDVPSTRALWSASLSTGEPYDAKHRLRLADGSYRWFRARAVAHRDQDGRILAWYGTSEDIDDAVRAESALRRSEERFRALVEASAATFWITTPDGRTLEESPSWMAFTGQSSHEVSGHGWVEAVHPEDRQGLLGAWQEGMASGAPFQGEMRLRHAASGSWRWVLGRAVPLFDDHGHIESWVGMNIDIEDRKRAEEALRESEEHYRYTVRTSPQFSWTADPQGQVLSVSSRLLDSTGAATADVVGSDWIQAIHPDDVAELTAAWARSVASGEPYDHEFRAFLADGTHRWFRSRAGARRGPDGAVIRWYGTLEDVHERKEAELALRESEEHHRFSVELNPQIPWTADAQGTVLDASSSWYRVTGTTLEETRGYDWSDNVHPEDRERARQCWARSMATGEPYDIEHRWRLADGTYGWFRARAAARRGDDGRIIRWYGTLEDIRDRKEAEERLHWAAHHDALTGLANRRLFQLQLEDALARARGTGRGVGLFMMDLDHFKQVNDQYGHDAGDALLQAFAQRLAGSVRSGDVVARLGGDEFAVILPDVAGDAEVIAAGEALLRRSQQPVRGLPVQFRTSIGGALMMAGESMNGEELIKRADIALYEGKTAGRGTFRFTQRTASPSAVPTAGPR